MLYIIANLLLSISQRRSRIVLRIFLRWEPPGVRMPPAAFEERGPKLLLGRVRSGNLDKFDLDRFEAAASET